MTFYIDIRGLNETRPILRTIRPAEMISVDERREAITAYSVVSVFTYIFNIYDLHMEEHLQTLFQPRTVVFNPDRNNRIQSRTPIYGPIYGHGSWVQRVIGQRVDAAFDYKHIATIHFPENRASAWTLREVFVNRWEEAQVRGFCVENIHRSRIQFFGT